METQVFEEFKAARTVPVNVRIQAEHLVLNLENVKQILSSAHTISVSVCSCCSCCCGILSGILRYGLGPGLLQSQAISVTDGSSCTDCGECVDRCQFGAREMVNGSLSFDQGLCFGCGLCVSTCPTQAIALVDKQ